MASIAKVESAAAPSTVGTMVNNFTLRVATVNGSGSQTANVAILRSLFRMGIPVSGKNIFPSNIQGLPTWYTIRLSASGYAARSDTAEILVAVNPATFAEDLRNLPAGGVCFHPDHLTPPEARDDVVFYPMPIQSLVQEANPPKNLRDYIANMAYVGVVAHVLGIELESVRSALHTHFHGRASAVDLNMRMVQAAADWARARLVKRDPYRVERSNQTEGMILVDGNTAAALGALYGGVTFAAWYPITPASSLAEALGEYLPQLRKDPDTGKLTCAVVQAEDEMAALGMAVGAGWAGARAMTSTSGPGLSLMAEFAGLAFFAEVPVVIWDVQRIGPSTGLPTRTSQGDILFARFLGHGDTKQVLLLPGTVAECFEFGWKAFDLAERLQTPILVLSDLDLGMNVWMTDPFRYPETPMDRGKVLTAEDLERVGSFARYRDVDGDGITFRTLPGNEHPLSAYFNRGTGHDELGSYSERPEHWEGNLKRIWRKLETARVYMPRPIVARTDGARVGLIAYGSSDPAVVEARDLLASAGIRTDYLRLRAVPFTEEVEEFVREHDRIYVIEMNLDGQMRQLLQIEYPAEAARLRSISKVDGMPLTARWVEKSICLEEEV
jgi:2-oxoglutarate ferredoxin oxidoreductase subunit alpha